jgi:hypothetical protein
MAPSLVWAWFLASVCWVPGLFRLAPLGVDLAVVVAVSVSVAETLTPDASTTVALPSRKAFVVSVRAALATDAPPAAGPPAVPSAVVVTVLVLVADRRKVPPAETAVVPDTCAIAELARVEVATAASTGEFVLSAEPAFPTAELFTVETAAMVTSPPAVMCELPSIETRALDWALIWASWDRVVAGVSVEVARRLTLFPARVAPETLTWALLVAVRPVSVSWAVRVMSPWVDRVAPAATLMVPLSVRFADCA